jgi:hypothetical protein
MLGHESNHAPAGRATQPKTRNRQLSGSNQAQSFAGRNRGLRRLGRKSLKLRIAKSDDFAGSFVYNDLAGLFVRRFLHARRDRLPRFTSRRSRSSWHEFWKSQRICRRRFGGDQNTAFQSRFMLTTVMP